jgi:uncharacterized membrane protein YeaQ/YmgE (transglycosylase-associated protein family)
MSIIAWIVLGLAAGLPANMVIPGRRSRGLVLTSLIGLGGALGGGRAATTLFHVHTIRGFVKLSTWLTAIAGSAIVLLAYHLVDGSRAGRAAHRQPTTGRHDSSRLRPAATSCGGRARSRDRPDHGSAHQSNTASASLTPLPS